MTTHAKATYKREQILRDLIAKVSDRLAWNLAAYGTAWTGEDEDTEFIVAPLLDFIEERDDNAR